MTCHFASAGAHIQILFGGGRRHVLDQGAPNGPTRFFRATGRIQAVCALKAFMSLYNTNGRHLISSVISV